MPALLLSSGLYMVPLAALAGFYRLIPPGTLTWAADSAELTVTAVSESVLLALRLAAPFVLASVAWFYIATFIIIPSYGARVHHVAESAY